ncbi:MAG TPA: L,D-transpeptidase [Bradyrhizobium sp.]|uniref:L,D-transpeptidase n=1 Tax=Bradyrhizobium sp. TaxID=376 RepID=UPI002CEA222E|nr:L,D-transpeptidase [Bradyrhizobium sp.]HLZ03267.1 L,D-transpeptidase [Bradyrhizobium sp.]
MSKHLTLALLAGASFLSIGSDRAAAFDGAAQEPTVIYANDPQVTSVRSAYADRSNMGGGFIQFLFGEGPRSERYEQQEPAYQQQPIYQQQPSYYVPQGPMPLGQPQPMMQQEQAADPTQRPFDPKYEKREVEYHGKEAAGTIVIDTPNKFLYLVESGGRALRYGIGVGRPGFTWSGVKTISAKKEWPDWTPPADMLARRPDLPRHMAGGLDNPLGARAMYLGSSLYRIHGSNEPWTIGTNVSSGCIRMRNQDVIDLYGRVNVGTKVVVL